METAKTIRKMKYHVTILAILAIIFITHSAADFHPRLYVYHEFQQALVRNLRNHYESNKKIAAAAYRNTLNLKILEVSANVQSVSDECEIKFEFAVKENRSIENCRESWISAINKTKNETIIALEACVTNNVPDLDVYDTQFRELITTGEDNQKIIEIENDKCLVTDSTTDCFDLRISEMGSIHRNFKKEVQKFKNDFKKTVNSARIAIQACYVNPLSDLDMTLRNIVLNSEKCLANYVYQYA